MQKLGINLKKKDKTIPKYFRFLFVLRINTAEPHNEPKNKLINNKVIWALPSFFKK